MTIENYKDLSVVIPAFNEELGLETTLKGLKDRFHGAELILVDDASVDNTSRVAKSIGGIIYLRHSFNRGQGAALKSGMRAATRKFVAWFDADNEHRVEDLSKMYEKINSKSLVAVIGQRSRASASLTRFFGKTLIRAIGRSLKIDSGSDLNCGLRIFNREILINYLQLIPDRFSASMITTLVLLERAYPIEFFPIITMPRIGNSTVKLKDGFEAILWLVRGVMLFAPIRIFLPIGIFLILLGSGYSTAEAVVAGRGLPAAGVLIIIAGFLLIMLGLIADQISQLRLNTFADPNIVESYVATAKRNESEIPNGSLGSEQFHEKRDK